MNKISSKLFEDISPVLFIGALLISSFIFAQDNDEDVEHSDKNESDVQQNCQIDPVESENEGS